MNRVHHKQLWNKHKVSPGLASPLMVLKLLNWVLVFMGSFEADECGWPAVRENLETVPPEPSAPEPSATRLVGLPTSKSDKRC